METILFGFALGLRHSSDADHLVAVSGLLGHAEQHTAGAARVGALWGLGHMLSVLATGGALVAWRARMPAWLEWSLELLVALVLIAIGVRAIAASVRGRCHIHFHSHGGWPHAHLHCHQRENENDHAAHLPQRWHGQSALLVGVAHGLAGTAGLALLVLATIPSPVMGVLYLLAFGGGALVGMAAFGAACGWPLRRLAARAPWFDAVRFAAGAANAGFGLFLAIRLLPQVWP